MLGSSRVSWRWPHPRRRSWEVGGPPCCRNITGGSQPRTMAWMAESRSLRERTLRPSRRTDRGSRWRRVASRRVDETAARALFPGRCKRDPRMRRVVWGRPKGVPELSSAALAGDLRLTRARVARIRTPLHSPRSSSGLTTSGSSRTCTRRSGGASAARTRRRVPTALMTSARPPALARQMDARRLRHLRSSSRNPRS